MNGDYPITKCKVASSTAVTHGLEVFQLQDYADVLVLEEVAQIPDRDWLTNE